MVSLNASDGVTECMRTAPGRMRMAVIRKVCHPAHPPLFLPLHLLLTPAPRGLVLLLVVVPAQVMRC